MNDMNRGLLEGPSRAVEHGAERAADVLSSLNVEAQRIIKERPGTVLLAALALGFVVGRFLSRR